MQKSLHQQATQNKPTTRKRASSLTTKDESHNMDSLRGIAKIGSPIRKPNMSDPQKQPKLKKKAMGKTASLAVKKKKRNRSPAFALDGVLQNMDGFFQREILPYENRTVNSAAELPDVTEEATEEIDKEVPRKKKRKPGLIDSEVDLMRTPPKRPTIAAISYPKPQHDLSIIQENVQDDSLINTTKDKKRRNLRTSQITKQISAAVSRAKKQKSKESAPHVDTEAAEKYPVLKDKELVKKFMTVQMTNNQKGRIRQVIKEILRGTSPTLLPEVLNNKIQTILRSSKNLTDTELRKIRILYNMLQKETNLVDKQPSAKIEDSSEKIVEDPPADTKKKKEKHKDKENKPKEKEKQKVKGVKRYVVFVGNMPVNVTREEIMDHFNDLRDYVKDIRIPQPADDRKSAYAYVELTTGISYEMALSKHHSMMGGKRINVLYTTQKNSKVSKAEAKAKSAKLIAMQKGGQLVGSIPLKKKRSQRRAKQRQAQRAAEKALEKNPIWRD